MASKGAKLSKAIRGVGRMTKIAQQQASDGSKDSGDLAKRAGRLARSHAKDARKAAKK